MFKKFWNAVTSPIATIKQLIGKTPAVSATRPETSPVIEQPKKRLENPLDIQTDRPQKSLHEVAEKINRLVKENRAADAVQYLKSCHPKDLEKNVELDFAFARALLISHKNDEVALKIFEKIIRRKDDTAYWTLNTEQTLKRKQMIYTGMAMLHQRLAPTSEDQSHLEKAAHYLTKARHLGEKRHLVNLDTIIAQHNNAILHGDKAEARQSLAVIETIDALPKNEKKHKKIQQRFKKLQLQNADTTILTVVPQEDADDTPTDAPTSFASAASSLIDPIAVGAASSDNMILSTDAPTESQHEANLRIAMEVLGLNSDGHESGSAMAVHTSIPVAEVNATPVVAVTPATPNNIEEEAPALSSIPEMDDTGLATGEIPTDESGEEVVPAEIATAEIKEDTSDWLKALEGVIPIALADEEADEEEAAAARARNSKKPVVGSVPHPELSIAS